MKKGYPTYEEGWKRPPSCRLLSTGDKYNNGHMLVEKKKKKTGTMSNIISAKCICILQHVCIGQICDIFITLWDNDNLESKIFSV